MKIEEAFKIIFQKKINVRRCRKPFYFYSFLSDLCSDSYKNIENVKRYFNLISQINIIDYIFSYDSKEIYEILLDKYINVENYLSYEEYSNYIRLTLNSYFKYTLKKENTEFNTDEKQFDNVLNIDEQVNINLCEFDIYNDRLVKYLGNSKVVEIPNSINFIATKAFENNKNIEKIILPDTIIGIRKFAFKNLPNLKEVIIGDIFCVENFAFWNSKCQIKCKEPIDTTFWKKYWNVYSISFFKLNRLNISYIKNRKDLLC